MNQQAILNKLSRAVMEMEPELAEKAAYEAIASGISPAVAIDQGLARGMRIISDKFDHGEAFVPQMLVAAEAFEAANAILTSNLVQEQNKPRSLGKVLVHTVQGDVHDIGKNIVKAFLVAAGFSVIDLGRDVPVEEVVDQAIKNKVDIIVGSALMTTTMLAQKKIIDALVKKGVRDRFIVMFGGASVTKQWVEKIGADGYSDSAMGAVRLAKRLIQQKKKGSSSKVRSNSK